MIAASNFTTLATKQNLRYFARARIAGDNTIRAQKKTHFT